MSSPKHRHSLLLSVAASVVVLLSAVAMLPSGANLRPAAGPEGQAPIARVEEYRAKPGSLAPLFTLADTDGAVFSLEAQRGNRSVLLVFESTDCQYCRQENSSLEALAAEYSDTATIVSLFPEPKSQVAAYRAESPAGRRFLPDPDGQLSLTYRALSTPTHFFIDPDGYITRTAYGYLEPDELEQYLSEAL